VWMIRDTVHSSKGIDSGCGSKDRQQESALVLVFLQIMKFSVLGWFCLLSAKSKELRKQRAIS